MKFLKRISRSPMDLKQRGVRALFIAWVLQAGLQEFHFFDRYDEADADHYAHTMPVGEKYSDHIAIVTITSEDYRERFHSRSPLDSGELLNIVRTIEEYRPRLIGVDFLTADWPTPLPDAAVRALPRTVWARDGRPAEPPDEDQLPRLTEWNGVVGQPTAPPGVCFAAPVHQPDSDGVIRRYSTSVLVGNRELHALYPTMATLLASAYSGISFGCSLESQSAVKRIRFTGANHRIRVLRVSDVLRDAANGRGFEKYLLDRIVLLGGTFDGRDQFASGGEYRSGANILANAIESEISGPIHELSTWPSLLLGLAVSMFLYFGFPRLPWPWDIYLSVVFLFVFHFAVGWLCYNFLHLFLPIASSLFSLPIGLLVEDQLGRRNEHHRS